MKPKTALPAEPHKIRIGVSACLLGHNVRYDGVHKLDRYITEALGRIFGYVPVCPEVECGLPVPRETLHLVRDAASIRLVTTRTGIDHTGAMRRWCDAKLDGLAREELAGFIFKSRSPSCGLGEVPVYDAQGMACGSGSGIFAAAFIHRNPAVPAIDEERLLDPALRRHFIDGVFFHARQASLKAGGLTADLAALHADLLLLILSHGPT